MADIISTIGLVYACNMMAEQAPVSLDQAMHCVKAHETVKEHFLSADEIERLTSLSHREQVKARLEGYRRFKAWENENQSLVLQIRREQRLKIAPGS